MTYDHARKPEKTTLNGMHVWYLSGTAQHEGSPIDWEVSVIEGKLPVVVVAVAKPGDLAKTVDHEFKALVGSIHPLAAAGH